MAMSIDKIEFNLTVKKSRDVNSQKEYGYTTRIEEQPKYEVYEQLDFKGLSAVEVVRKLLDYIS